MKCLKTKVSSLAYSLEDDYVDDFKDILGEILKDNDCEVLSENNETAECTETEKDTELVVRIVKSVILFVLEKEMKENKINKYNNTSKKLTST